MKKHVVVCLTSRGNYGTIGSVLHALNDEHSIELDIIVAGASMIEKYGRLSDMLTEDGLEVTRELYNLLEGGTPESAAKTTGLSMIEFTNEISQLNPDAVITIGDRYETMAVTLAGSYLNIPVVHTHGGEITGSIDEKVRHATTKIADYHIVATERSKAIVERLGEAEDRVFLTGCPSMDIAAEIADGNDEPYDPQADYDGGGSELDVTEDYLVVQYHPVHTEYESQYERTWTVLSAIDALDKQVFWFWPNMDVGNEEVSRAIRAFREERDPENFKFFVNLHPRDYLRLVNGATCYVGNSSVAIRECSFLGQPSVNIGDRQQYREQVENVVDVACDTEAIRAAVSEQMKIDAYPKTTLYGDGNAAERIKDILLETDLTLKPSMTPAQVGLTEPSPSNQ